MLNVIVKAGERVLDSGEYYFAGDGALEAPSTVRLPVLAFRHGWHGIELWGTWAARPEAQLKFHTPFRNGAPVLVAARLHAPPGSVSASCTLRVGDTVSRPRRISWRPRWFLAEGVTGPDGVVSVAILSNGKFGRPDAREIFAGLHSIAFCAADDAEAREAFLRKMRPSPAAVARIAARGVMSAWRRSRDGGFKALLAERTSRRAPSEVSTGPTPVDLNERMADLKLPDSIHELAPELAARPTRDLYHHHSESIEVRLLGRNERTRWGMSRTLRGIESVRGFCISLTPIRELQVLLNGQVIHRGPVRGGYELKYELDKTMQKYVFNVWHDFSAIPHGRYELELRFTDAGDGMRSHREQIVVASPLDPKEYASSDRVVAVPAGGGGTLEERVDAMPSMVRSARREYFEIPIRNVLISRADQLGDMVASIPALRKLREVFPTARLVGLLSAANEGLARSVGVFDEIIVVDFPDVELERRRVMSIEQQIALKAKLAPYRFEVAIDLSDSGVSRPILLLAGARYNFGFRPEEHKWLSSALVTNTQDPANGLENIPHTTKVMSLATWLGLLAKSHAVIVTRPDLSRDPLAEFGLAARDRYAVLHTGARLKFSRWPHYGKLAQMILERTDLKVIMLADDGDERAKLDASVLNSDRFRLLEQRLSFDQFDALVSFCDAFVGNDSGPKHLASLRGANVVSIHLARNNWNEWGQENKGFIASRRVPCAGCSIHHDPEECGKDFACITNIRPEEIFGAVSRVLEDAGSAVARAS